MNLTLNIENEISLLSKYKLTCDELMFVRVTLIYQEDGREEFFAKYYKLLGSINVSIRDLLVSLKDKGVILKSYILPKPGTSLNPMEIAFNKNFVKNLFKSSFEMGEELFQAYPQFATINGVMVPLRSISKKFDSLEDAYFKYGKYIKWNPEKHKEIIDLLHWANENNVLNCSLASFIVNNSWNDLASMKEGNAINYNYNAIREL